MTQNSSRGGGWTSSSTHSLPILSVLIYGVSYILVMFLKSDFSPSFIIADVESKAALMYPALLSRPHAFSARICFTFYTSFHCLCVTEKV